MDMRRPVRGLGIACLLLAAPRAAVAQTLIFEMTDPDGTFGVAMAGVGDVNGDGHDDIAIGIPFASKVAPLAGAVELRSGRDASVLWRFDANRPQGKLGGTLAPMGDVDGDGVPDVLAGALVDNSGWPESPMVLCLSGADGHPVLAWQGAALEDHYGTALSAAGDVDADGVVDVVVGAPQGWYTMEAGAGYAEIRSGADGGLLDTLNGAGELKGAFGRAVSGAGDINGDGLADVLVGAPLALDKVFHGGAARLFSGADGGELGTVWGDVYGGLFGREVAGAGDVNADGTPDVAVTGLVGGYQPAWTGKVLSGVKGQLLWMLPGTLVGSTSGYAAWGWSIEAAGDLDGDGHDDLVLNGEHSPSSYLQQGVAIAASGKDGSVLFFVEGHPETPPHGPYFAWTVASAGDVNGDGCPDIAASGTGYTSLPSYVRIVSGQALEWPAAGGGSPGASFMLGIDGALQPNSVVHAKLHGGLPQAMAWIVIGTHTVDLALASGVLVPAPEVVTAVPLDALGGADVIASCDPALPAGLQLWVQAFAPTPVTPAAMVASPAVSAVTH